MLRNFKVSDENLITCTESYVTIYNQDLDTLDLLYAYNGSSGIFPNDIIYGNGYYWIADDSKGFVKFKNNFSSERIGLGGPFTSECFHLSAKGENLYVAAGTPDGSNWNKTFNWHGVFQFNNIWSFYNQINIPTMFQEIDTISDIVWTTPNPNNENKFLASSFWGGLLSFNGYQIEERFTFHNSSLQTRIGKNGNNVFVAGSCYDNLENLWVANSFVTSPLSVKTPEGVWKSFLLWSTRIQPTLYRLSCR